MPIDVDVALAAPAATKELSWTGRDVLLYHLSLGAGRDTAAGPQLSYTFERDMQILPTFAMVAGQGISVGDQVTTAIAVPGIDIDLRKVLHAGQALTVHRPIPQAGAATVRTRVANVWDKGEAALIVTESEATSPEGDLLWSSEMQIWARGEGGFGGESGPKTPWAAPSREPDFVIESPTTPDQALIYRLNGDMNPLHADPAAARAAGFERPILHGLASYGIVAKAVVDGVLDGNAAGLRALSVRFAEPICPGETIRTAVWRDGDDLTLTATCPDREDAPVLSHATARLGTGRLATGRFAA